ncbi:hypothetical protein J4226_03460 [Candidatus Pacearchaeota archaeon]|nr:hypothetical protein [Candidatus Pacearchaeota archaeon]
MNKCKLIWIIVVIKILLIALFFWFSLEIGSYGIRDEDCVAASCCHAVECIGIANAPDCSGTFCTMECKDGAMDCGAGHCGVVDGKCGVVWDE